MAAGDGGRSIVRPGSSRRSGGPPTGRLDRLAYLLLAVFGAVTVGPAILGRGALADLNILTMYQPWLAIDGRSTVDTILCRADTVDYYLPGVAAIKQAFYAGDFPTWAPYEVGGAPLAALPNHAMLSPMSLPYLVLPLWLAPAFVKLLEFVVGIGGMVAFLGRHGVSRGAGVLAGIVFMSSGFMVMWSNWPHTRVGALIPLLFWAIEKLVQERRARDVVVIALVVASMLLGGFPAVTLFSLTLAAAYVVVRVVTCHRSDLRAAGFTLAGSLGGVALGVGLAAVQIVPFVRHLDSLGLEERQFDGVHHTLGLFMTTVAPGMAGLCVNGEDYGRINPIEGVGFVGAAAMVLVVVALLLRVPRSMRRDRSPVIFLAVAAGVVLIAVWLGGPLLSAIQSLPFYSSNSITRARSVFGFLAACLAGIGIERLLVSTSQDRQPSAAVDRRGKLVYGGLVAAALLVIAAFTVQVARSAREVAAAEGYTAQVKDSVGVPAVLIGLAVAAVLLAVAGPRRLRVAGPVLLAVLVVGQSTMFVRTMLPLSDPENLYPVTPTHAFLQDNLGGDRYAAGDQTMYTAVSDYYELRTPVGHEFTDQRWKDLLAAFGPRTLRTRTYSMYHPAISPELAGVSEILDQLAVRYWVAAPERVSGTVDPSGPAPDEIVLENGERARCQIRGGALRGVKLDLARPLRPRVASQPVMHVAVHTPDGVRRGERWLTPRTHGRGPFRSEPDARALVEAKQLRVAVTGEDLASARRYPVEVWVTGVEGSVVLRGKDGEPACSAVRPQDDGLRVAFADAGSTVYERPGYLPRIRWASRAEVVEVGADRVDRLKAGLADDTVLLDSEVTREGRAHEAEGRPARTEVLQDRPERISVRVRAQGSGYLVVADSLVRDGWRATVDGETVPLVRGNHAFAAVPVPAGEHAVELAYTAPGLRTGVVTSAGSLLAAAALLVVPPLVRRRRRPESVEAADGTPGQGRPEAPPAVP